MACIINGKTTLFDHGMEEAKPGDRNGFINVLVDVSVAEQQ
jgi:hypothetical protein